MPKSIKEKIKFFLKKKKLKKNGVVLHHHAYIAKTIFLGKAVIEPYCRFIGADKITIGERFYANVGCHFLGNITIGSDVMIGPKTVIWGRDHGTATTMAMNQQKHISEDIKIENNVWIGANVTILKGVRIGTGVIIGAGSVVVNDIDDNCIAVGNPAKVIKKRSEIC
ncbi:acyltransferase [Pseudoalteromonas sp. Ld20]|uniref:acyltransferase n=1 Tax=Pseudoalteromonas sp. Ld20 TaxID=649165 RepID=UPI00386B4982